MQCTFCEVPCLFLPEESTYVCKLCGHTTTTLQIAPVAFGENVCVCMYSRTKRFEIMLKALLYPSFDTKDEHIYTHLQTRESYTNIGDLVTAMKSCNLKEKRFHSIHLFSRLLCEDYSEVTAPPHHYFKRIMILFDELLTLFNATKKTKFFSYPWLLRKLLNLTNEFRYDKFIKKIRCKKRNRFYKDMFAELVHKAPKHYLIWVCATCT